MGELEEKGHNGDSAETALLVHKQDVNKVSRLSFAWCSSFSVTACLLSLLNVLFFCLVTGLSEASGSV